MTLTHPILKGKSVMKQKIKNNFKYLTNSLPFGLRLFLSFFSITIPIVIIISIFLYIFLGQSSQENIARMMLQTLEKTKSQIENIISDTEYLSRNIIYDDDVQKMLKEAAAGVAYPEEEAVKYFINSFIVNREYMDSVVLLGNNTTLFSTEKATTNISSIENIQKKWWYTYLDPANPPFQWFTSARDDIHSDTNPKSLMLTRIIRSTDDYKSQLGRMMIYISDDYLENIWDGIQWGNTLNVWVFNESQEILCQNSPEKNYLECAKEVWNIRNTKDIYSEVISFQGKTYVVGLENFEDHEWTMIMAVPLLEVNENHYMIYLQICIMVVISLIIIIIATLVISKNVSRPVQLISEVMDGYHDHRQNKIVPDKEENLQIMKTFEERKDEIGKIYRSYEQMVERVDKLIKDIYIKDLEKKDAELALMQSQINPHFLYNTLDSINWLAMVNDQDEISEMVTALSDTFRLSLRRSNSPYISIRREMEYIDSYMTLQKIRFGDRLQYRTDIAEDIKDLYMLRFILQPIIENAIKHGISIREEGGSIEIHFIIKDKLMTIDIINDGADINMAQMQKILAFDVDTDTFLNFTQQGYGLQNINRRIKIMHGVQYGLNYSVIDNIKTVCTVTLPVIENDADIETDLKLPGQKEGV